MSVEIRVVCVYESIHKNINSLRLHCFGQNVYLIKYNFNQQFSNYFFSY